MGHSYDGESSRSFHSRSAIRSRRSWMLLTINSGEYPDISSPVPIWEWMKSIREGRTPVASLYFPDHLCGPDIVFALAPEDADPGDRVLCVLQVSLGLNAETDGPLTFVRLES